MAEKLLNLNFDQNSVCKFCQILCKAAAHKNQVPVPRYYCLPMEAIAGIGLGSTHSSYVDTLAKFENIMRENNCPFSPPLS